jgi:cell division septation protein DedD
MTFEDGLQQPATEGLPQTRDPDAPKPESDSAPDEADTKNPPKPTADTKSDVTLAAASANAPSVDLRGKKFTLQMKAFARKEDAEAFANRLRSNGHPVRVEAHEVKGRLWHRVRLGAFEHWSDGLAAKEAFEKQEQLIAYVVRI